jgi:hypothetical protein
VTAAWPAPGSARGIPTGAPTTSRASVGEVREDVGISRGAPGVVRDARGTSSDARLLLRWARGAISRPTDPRTDDQHMGRSTKWAFERLRLSMTRQARI